MKHMNDTMKSVLQVQDEIRNHTGLPVRYGPFAGMQIPLGSHFYYLLGTYEKELHAFIRAINSLSFKRIINVGACDGYYAVGLGLLHPESHIVALESVQGALAGLSHLATANDIGDRFEVGGKCTIGDLNRYVSNGDNCLVVMDCEGDEWELLNPSSVPGLLKAHILVELHDFVRAGLSEVIRSRFCGSHTIREAKTQTRTIADLPYQPDPKNFTDELKPLYVSAINENRPCIMTFFYMEPR